MLRRLLLLVLAGWLLVLPLAAPAGAQQYTQAGNADCAIAEDEDGDEKSSFAPGETIVVAGDPPPGQVCGDIGASVTVTVESAPITLAVTSVDSFGGYEIEARLPTTLSRGTHTVRATTRFQGRTVEYTQAITIAGAVVGLPTTGREIALLVLWALFLVGFGSVLVSATWRRWREAKLETTFGLSRQDEGTSIAAAIERPVPDVEVKPLVELRPVSTPAIPVGLPQHDAASTNGEIQEVYVAAQVEEVVQRASSRASDLVNKLQDEIKSWAKTPD